MSSAPATSIHRVLLAIVGLIGSVALVGVIVLWPGGASSDVPDSQVQHTRLVNATLAEVQPVVDADPAQLLPGAIEVLVAARIDATGERVSFQTSDDAGGMFRAGQRVRLAVTETEGQPTVYYISDFRREAPLGILLALFLGSVVLFGRRHGAQALLGLALTFVVIIGFIVPAILADRSPVAVALVGSLAIMVVTLYLSHGWSQKTTAAVVGTAAALLVTAALAAAFVAATSITGFASEDARMANLQVGGLSLRGLLLAGMIIGGLGVLDDVTMSQSSTVFALRRANPAASFAELVRGALSVGHDHIAATVNTLFLAYAGASLPLLIVFSTGIDPVGVIVTSETVAIEIVRALVGSIGLIAAVPLTTAMAAALAIAQPTTALATAVQDRETHAGHHHGAQPNVRIPGPPSPQRRLIPDQPSLQLTGEDPEWEQRLRQAYRLPTSGEPH
ncbi:MAG: YibE/F family protein [Egibacteraceae bacterium]